MRAGPHRRSCFFVAQLRTRGPRRAPHGGERSRKGSGQSFRRRRKQRRADFAATRRCGAVSRHEGVLQSEVSIMQSRPFGRLCCFFYPKSCRPPQEIPSSSNSVTTASIFWKQRSSERVICQDVPDAEQCPTCGVGHQAAIKFLFGLHKMPPWLIYRLIVSHIAHTIQTPSVH